MTKHLGAMITVRRKFMIGLLLIGLAWSAGCVSTAYDGVSYEPTKSIEVYEGFSRVRSPYVIMGEGQSYGSQYVSYQQLEEAMVKLAMSKGADAVVLDPLESRVIGSDVRRSTDDVPVPFYYRDEVGRLRRRTIDYQRSELEHEHQIVLKGSLIKYQQPTAPVDADGDSTADESTGDEPTGDDSTSPDLSSDGGGASRPGKGINGTRSTWSFSDASCTSGGDDVAGVCIDAAFVVHFHRLHRKELCTDGIGGRLLQRE